MRPGGGSGHDLTGEKLRAGMKILIAGIGSIGKRHLRNVASLGGHELIATDPRSDRRDEARALGATAFADLDEALGEKPDAVFITSPTAMHLSMALRAARAGCHLFVEKPLAHSWEGVPELLDEMESRNLIGFVASNWRFHPSFQRMKSALESGTLGKVLSARCQFGQYLPDWHPWEDYRKGYSAQRAFGGGILRDCHEFDYLMWFLGGVAQVGCMTGHQSSLEIDTEDTAAAILRFRSGVIGELHVDYTQRAYQRTFEFIGELGTLSWSIRDRSVKLFSAKKELAWTMWDEPAGYDLNRMYVDEVSSFLNAVTSDKPVECDLRHGSEVLKVILAAERSSAESRFVGI